jgi:hypothetical protein
MNVIVFVIGLIILVAILFIVYRYVTVQIQNKKLSQSRFDRIKPLHEKLESRQDLHPEFIFPYAQNLLTRQEAFLMLNHYNRADLFPKEFYTIEKGAESNLAIWLEFPTELGACPDEIELVKKVSLDIDSNKFLYFVFKFRINEPHWASKDGWMIGVVGPYYDNSRPYDFPSATFSRFDSRFETTSPDEEAKWVHENIFTKFKN